MKGVALCMRVAAMLFCPIPTTREVQLPFLAPCVSFARRPHWWVSPAWHALINSVEVTFCLYFESPLLVIVELIKFNTLVEVLPTFAR